MTMRRERRETMGKRRQRKEKIIITYRKKLWAPIDDKK
jgi:hypothetical protein